MDDQQERIARLERTVEKLLVVLEAENDDEKKYFDATEPDHATHNQKCKAQRAMYAEIIAAEAQRIAEARIAWGQES